MDNKLILINIFMKFVNNKYNYGDGVEYVNG